MGDPLERPSVFAERILGFNLHDTQKEFVDTRAKVKVASCGRRWGKSYAEAVDLIHFAVGNPGSSQFVIAPTADQATVIINYIEAMLYNSPILQSADSIRIVRSPFPRVDVKDSVIHARSAGDSGKRVRGHGADRLIFDEAAFIPDSVFDAVSPLLAQSSIGERVLISTPFGHNHFYEEFSRGTLGEDGYCAFRFPSATNPHLSASYLAQEKASKTSLIWEVEYEGLFREDQNAVFPISLIQSCLDVTITDEPHPNHRYVIGYDPAKWQDRSGVVVLDVTEKPYRAVFITDISGRDYLTQAADIGLLTARYNRAPVLMDATSHDQMLEQLKRDGIKASGFKFTNESKQELVNGLVIAMEQGRLTIPSDPLLIDELKYYRYELTAAGNVKLGADEKHHDDLVTALALAVKAAGHPVPILAPTSTTQRARWTGHSYTE